MTPHPADRARRVREVFDAALDRPPEERAAYLADACADDGAIRGEVDSLLAAHTEGDDVVKRAVREAAQRVTKPLRVGTMVGPYRVLEPIGEGGMGSVYLAERSDEAFRMQVAIKVVRGGLDSGRVLARFHAERRILASLQHPNIARVLDAGSTPDGLPYLVMEYVAGQSIDRFCEERHFRIRERIGIFRKICTAVDHAHRRLVVHRDLKPANVLVTEDGEPKLLDFGIAKLLEDGGDSGQLTGTNVRAMTPEYASPEQIRGDAVSTATDVHALGIVLYELLAGKHPFEARTTTPRDLEEAVLDRDPASPSTAAGRRELAGDLDNIVLKALAKEPERRYPSAAELSADLARFLGGRPVTARPATFSYRAGKFLRRNAVATGIAVAFAATIVAAAVVSTRAYLRADRLRVEAEMQRDTLQEINTFLARTFQAASPEKRQSPEEITAREILDAAAARVNVDLYDRPEIAGAVQTEVGRRYYDLGLLEPAEELLREAAERFRSAGREGTPEGVTALVYLGHALTARSAHDEAVSVLTDAVRGAAELGSGDFEIYVVARQALAIVRVERGDHAEAQALLEGLLSDLDHEPWQSDPEFAVHRAAVANDLGLLRERQGDYEQAVAHLRSAVERGTVAHGERHSKVGEFWANLAYVLNRAGRLEEGVDCARHALSIHEEVLGEDHLQVANSRLNLADALAGIGEIEEAELHYPLVLESYRRIYGEDHPTIGTVLNNSAIALLGQGAPGLALPKFQEAQRIYAEAFGKEHQYTAIAGHNVARALRRAGRADEAEAACRETLALRRRIFEGDHPDVARSLVLLAGILRDRGADAEAEPLLEEAVKMSRSGLAPDHPVRVSAERELEALRNAP